MIKRKKNIKYFYSTKGFPIVMLSFVGLFFFKLDTWLFEANSRNLTILNNIVKC